MTRTHVLASLLIAPVLLVLGALPLHTSAACDSAALNSKVVFGGSGPAVRALQACLIEAGYTIPAGPTGYYGGQTQTAVKQFYAAALGMPQWDGRSVGPQGRAKLAALAKGQGKVPGPIVGYRRAGSATELAKYIVEDGAYFKGNVRGIVPTATQEDAAVESRVGAAAPLAAGSTGPARVSETNVQVAGIDEPDIVKTDGETIYISKEGWWGGIMPADVIGMSRESSIAIAPPYDAGKTIAVDAFPVDSLKVISERIDTTGELLLVKGSDVLIVLAYPSIVAYDVKNPASPKEKWKMTLEDSTSLVGARLRGSTLYLVTQTWLNSDVPCPIVPITRGSAKVSIPCADIWIPKVVEPANTAYSLLVVDAVGGAVEKNVSIAADQGSATVSMFERNLYLASRSYGSPYATLIECYIEAAKPLVSASTYAKIIKVNGYDMSSEGKLGEIQRSIGLDMQSLSSDERMRRENEMTNALESAVAKKKRELERTRIARVSLESYTVAAVGEVPGTLLNQFSLDEYDGSVRVAVTVGGGWGFGFGGESVNDVYVLDTNLATIGSIKDLGISERIHAARFIGTRGYLVTFRQIDPFYVLDLRVPSAPKLAGELKIPGYSAYLEPLGDDLVLGVGREGSGVKLSVFDVSNPALPRERSKYMLNDGWTEVEQNHRAFLKDALHKVFFIPGGNGGYVFSYEGGTLSLKATVSGWQIKRAVYIDDYLYIIGLDKIVVFDEGSWKEVKRLAL